MINNFIKNIFLLILSLSISHCGGGKQFIPPSPLPNDMRHIDKPKSRKTNAYAEYFNRQVTVQGEESFDFSRQLRKLFGNPKEAMNVNTFGGVENSSWFTNRNGKRPLTLEEISRGPNTVSGPDTSGTWLVIRAKAEGVTPGFTIKDKHGDFYLIKFDPIGYAELASGAEVVTTKLFYAAGYNVPENFVTRFHPHILKMADQVKYTDDKGRTRFMNEKDMQDILSAIQKQPDGTIRALASKYVKGEPIGPFQYKELRKDDPNDIVPHEHRRELRGLRLFAAWLNHFDTKDGNSLDSYVTENGISFVKHFLIDFGATLGSASWGPNHPWRGHQNDYDPEEWVKNIASLGLNVHAWEKLPDFEYPSIGIYESETFDPEKYKCQVPNPAFENLTLLDGYWAAKIIMSFSDEQLQAVVRQGQYSNPEAEAYLLKTLIARRDKIGRVYFSKVAPLDNFRIVKRGNSAMLDFEDLAIKYGFEEQKNFAYRYDLTCKNKVIIHEQKIDRNLFIPLHAHIAGEANPIDSILKSNYFEIKIQVKRASEKSWSKAVTIYLKYNENQFKILGITREG